MRLRDEYLHDMEARKLSLGGDSENRAWDKLKHVGKVTASGLAHCAQC